ncbi:MAG TPA: MobF family relaxase, partial [Gaiellaceae bacterium]|nr:MobF family relaxase [Gaiellaceae bacterium]
MIVSVTVLGAVGRSQDAIADDVVAYVEKGRAHSRAGQRPGSVIELPSPDGGTVAYYADSSGLRPGRWVLGEAGEVDPKILKAVLSGVHPVAGKRLLSGSGHAVGADHARSTDTHPAANAEWYTAREAAAALGVSDSYVQRHCRRAVRSGDDAAMAGIERSEDGRTWRIHRDALVRLAARRQPKQIVVGYDLTYSVPKSVSVLWAGGDDATKAAVLEAFDEAVAAGTRYFDRHALVVRVRGEQQRAEDVFAADYLHLTSRALEPQLHHHVVVANYGKAKDGEGRALDARMLFIHAKTASFLAGAELRHQLTARLGVVWGEIVNGIAEIEGVPERARTEMSTRSKEIAAALDELGFHSARARQVAALDTRAAKEHGVDIDALMAVWDERLSTAGYGASEREAVLRQVDAPGLVVSSDLERLFADLSRIAGITANEAIFDRRRVVQVLSEFAGDRLSGDAIDELADRFLTQPAVVQLQGSTQSSGNVIRRDDGRMVAVPGDAIYSTRPMLELEARAVAAYERGRGTGVGVVAESALAGVLAEEQFARLSDEQRLFVRSLTTSGMRIQAAVGAAGSGKTTALEAAVEAWSRAGYTVVGAAVGGTQTVILGEEAHVEARTVTSVIARYFHFGNLESIDEHTVLLVDEASLLSTQDFALLAQAVEERGGSLRIVGDPAQHNSVAAGGIFRHLVETHPDEVPALAHIYRQQGPEMAEVRLANAEYREAKITEALERLERDGRITEAESAEQAIDLLTCAWYAERERRRADPDRRPSSMTAEHHFERIALNARARVLLQADGTLSGRELTAAGLSFQRGDDVIARIGDHDLRADGAPRRSWVRNGSLGVVRGVAKDHLVVEFERWGEVVVPQEYIEREVAPGVRGALQHGYALTTHAAQGSTFA